MESQPVFGGATNLVLEAYDCSMPKELTDMDIEFTENCDRYNQSRVTNQRSVVYSLMQKERFRRFGGWSCSVVVDKHINYCGRYDHQTRISSWSKVAEPAPVTTAECNRMVGSRNFIDSNGNPHELDLNATTSIFYYEKGKEMVSEGGEGKCTGETVNVDGTLMYQAVVGVFMKITLE